jgi:hypothetical protein
MRLLRTFNSESAHSPGKIIKAFIAFWVLVLLLSNSSCEKALLGSDPDPTPTAVFEYLWNDLHERYAFFELKQIDWESVRETYQPQIQEGMDSYTLFEVLANLLFELEDGHVNLTGLHDRSRNWEWFQNFPSNYNDQLVEQFYLKRDYRITGSLLNQVIDSVLYLNYRSFASVISQDDLDEIMARAVGLRGVIIDVRSNGGGNLLHALRLASCFTETGYEYAKERLKDGPGPDDFTDWRPMRVEPRNGLRFMGPVVVLTNRRSYSATTFFAQMMRENPRATLMGDQTGGGGGIPAYGELPNGWKYRFSASQTINLQGEHLEPGVPVDIELELLESDAQNGFDTLIEAALELLNS